MSAAALDWSIKEGDFVTVQFPDTPYNNRGIYGKVLHVPQAAGECWVIDTDSHIHYVQHFSEIRKEKPL